MSQKKNQLSEKSLSVSNSLLLKLSALLLFIHFVLVLHAASRMTVTHDEYWHLPVGHLNLTTGQFDYDNLNPPLLRMWAAIPLLFSETNPVNISPETDPTGHGDAFLKANVENYHQLFFRGRIMIALLSVGTGILLGFWSAKWFGNLAALMTVGLWSFSANVVAHASLVTTDLGASFFFIATLFSLDCYLKKPKWGIALLLGILLGLSQLAKYTSLILYPICFLFLVIRIAKKQEEENNRKKLLIQGIFLLGISLVTINAGYLFDGSFQSLKSYAFESSSLKNISEQFSFVDSFPVPFPADYLEGIDHQRKIMESQHPVYLDGQWSLTPFPQYYLMTLIYKVPHAVQGLFLISCFLVFRASKNQRKFDQQVFLLLPFLVLFFIASRSSMQLGIRYLLPVFPLMFLFIGQVGSLVFLDEKENPVLKKILLVLLIAVPFSVRQLPYHISYFNELAGGAKGGQYHLLDSNLDWGQDLRELKKYLDENPVDKLKLAYFGMLLPAELGIDYELPQGKEPQPGWHAVSVNYIQGRPHHIRDMDGKSHPLGPYEFGYLRFFEPDQILGTSIYLYHLEQDDINRYQAALRQMHQSR